MALALETGPVVGFCRVTVEAGAHEIRPCVAPQPVESGSLLDGCDWEAAEAEGRAVVVESERYEVMPTATEYLGEAVEQASRLSIDWAAEPVPAVRIEASRPIELVITGLPVWGETE
jgi:hypothetical protein